MTASQDTQSPVTGAGSAPARKHTPGPWGVEPSFSGKMHWIGPMRSDGRKVDTIVVGLEGGDGYTAEHNARAEANAHLIASAPELLAALRVARDFIETEVEMREAAGSEMSDYQGEAQDALDRVCAAIAKALGQ